MQCNECGKPMEQGRLEVHGTALGFIFRGLSLQDLYWYNKDRKRGSRRRVIDSNASKKAYGCKPCGLITLDTTTKLQRPGRRS